MNEVETLIHRYDCGESVDKKELLKKLKISCLRRPDIVIENAQAVIKSEAADEALNYQEQVSL